MRKILCNILFLLIFSCFFSCDWNNDDDSAYTAALLQLLAQEQAQSQTDVLFMMYMDGDNNLHDITWKNIIQAQKGLMNIGSTTKITVVALVDGNSSYQSEVLIGGKSYLLTLNAYSADEYYNTNSSAPVIAAATKDHSQLTDWVYNGSGIASQEVDMSAGNTLYNFLNWAKNKYTASKTILVMQNHGGGPYNEAFTSVSARSLCQDYTTGTKRYLSTTDVANAINKTFGKIDLLVEDVCLQCSIEETFGLQDAVNYLIASPNSTFGNTYNYDKIIPDISSGKSILETGRNFVDYNMDFCKNLSISVDSNKDEENSCRELSLTLIDCSQKDTLSNIKAHTSELAEALLNDTDEMQTSYKSKRVGKVYNKNGDFNGLSFATTYLYTQDLGIMAYMLANNTPDASQAVKEAAEKLYTDLKNGGLIVYSWSGGSEHSWYYSGNSSYGDLDYLRITDGKCPWGISITCSTRRNSAGYNRYYQIDDYGLWSNFANGNKWADLMIAWHGTWRKKS